MALITGAAIGIGRETALAFAKEGANIVVSDVLVEDGEETVQMVKEAGADAVFVRANVAEAA